MSRLGSRTLTLVLGAWATTWRLRVRGATRHDAVASGPFLFALWHHALLPLLWYHRHRGIALLVSRHKDGELVARAARLLGYRVIRGSSTRGGEAAFRGVLRALDAGIPVAITPDGPHGPARVPKPGIARAALRAGVPILPVMVRTDDAWRLASWDGLLVPKPFAGVDVAYGTPLRVERGDRSGALADLAQRLDALTEDRRTEAM